MGLTKKKQIYLLNLSSIQEEDFRNSNIKIIQPSIKKPYFYSSTINPNNQLKITSELQFKASGMPFSHSNINDYRLSPLYFPSIESNQKSTKNTTYNNTINTQEQSDILNYRNNRNKALSSPPPTNKDAKHKMKHLNCCFNYFFNKQSLIPGPICVIRNNSESLFTNHKLKQYKAKEPIIGKTILLNNIHLLPINFYNKKYLIKIK